jgi:hypothetical protein
MILSTLKNILYKFITYKSFISEYKLDQCIRTVFQLFREDIYSLFNAIQLLIGIQPKIQEFFLSRFEFDQILS